MKKSIKTLICIFIIVMLIQVNVFASTPTQNATASEITNFCDQNKDLSNLDEALLSAWCKTLENDSIDKKKEKVVISGIYSENDFVYKEVQAYDAICKELISKGNSQHQYYGYTNVDKNTYNFEDITDESSLNYWKPTTGHNDKITDMAGKILGIIQVFGSVVSVLALVVIGIKYMLGSVEEKAKYKETMLPYIVGCIMLFAITNIATALYKIGTGL